MKFNFSKILGKKQKRTRVSKVRVMTGNLSTRSRTFVPPEQVVIQSTTPPEEEILKTEMTRTTTPPEQVIAKTVEPPSPNCVMEQSQLDERICSSSEEKDSESSPGWNVRFIGFTCSDSFNTPSSKTDGPSVSMSSTEFSETMERWNEFKTVVNTKMKSMHGNLRPELMFPKVLPTGDLGESAMEAVAKNRNEMDEMVGKLDPITSVVDPVTWFWNKENVDEETNDGPILTCSDIKGVCPRG